MPYQRENLACELVVAYRAFSRSSASQLRHSLTGRSLAASAASRSSGVPPRQCGWTIVCQSASGIPIFNCGFGYEYARFLAQALRDVAEGRVTIPVSDAVERLCGRRAYDANDFATNYARSLAH